MNLNYKHAPKQVEVGISQERDLLRVTFLKCLRKNTAQGVSHQAIVSVTQLHAYAFPYLLFIVWCLFQWTETGPHGQIGHCVRKFVMAGNRLAPESAITQRHNMAVMTAWEISGKQDPVTFSHVLVRLFQVFLGSGGFNVHSLCIMQLRYAKEEIISDCGCWW